MSFHKFAVTPASELFSTFKNLISVFSVEQCNLTGLITLEKMHTEIVATIETLKESLVKKKLGCEDITEEQKISIAIDGNSFKSTLQRLFPDMTPSDYEAPLNPKPVATDVSCYRTLSEVSMKQGEINVNRNKQKDVPSEKEDVPSEKEDVPSETNKQSSETEDVPSETEGIVSQSEVDNILEREYETVLRTEIENTVVSKASNMIAEDVREVIRENDASIDSMVKSFATRRLRKTVSSLKKNTKKVFNARDKNDVIDDVEKTASNFINKIVEKVGNVLQKSKSEINKVKKELLDDDSDIDAIVKEELQAPFVTDKYIIVRHPDYDDETKLWEHPYRQETPVKVKDVDGAVTMIDALYHCRMIFRDTSSSVFSLVLKDTKMLNEMKTELSSTKSVSYPYSTMKNAYGDIYNSNAQSLNVHDEIEAVHLMTLLNKDSMWFIENNHRVFEISKENGEFALRTKSFSLSRIHGKRQTEEQRSTLSKILDEEKSESIERGSIFTYNKPSSSSETSSTESDSVVV